MAMVCAEKVQLIEIVAATASVLSAATTALYSKTGSGFREAVAVCKAARANRATARRALQEHKAKHLC